MGSKWGQMARFGVQMVQIRRGFLEPGEVFLGRGPRNGSKWAILGLSGDPVFGQNPSFSRCFDGFGVPKSDDLGSQIGSIWPIGQFN